MPKKVIKKRPDNDWQDNWRLYANENAPDIPLPMSEISLTMKPAEPKLTQEAVDKLQQQLDNVSLGIDMASPDGMISMTLMHKDKDGNLIMDDNTYIAKDAIVDWHRYGEMDWAQGRLMHEYSQKLLEHMKVPATFFSRWMDDQLQMPETDAQKFARQMRTLEAPQEKIRISLDSIEEPTSDAVVAGTRIIRQMINDGDERGMKLLAMFDALTTLHNDDEILLANFKGVVDWMQSSGNVTPKYLFCNYNTFKRLHKADTGNEPTENQRRFYSSNGRPAFWRRLSRDQFYEWGVMIVCINALMKPGEFMLLTQKQFDGLKESNL